MKDLIDRQAAIKEIENEFAEVLTSHGYDSFEKADIFYQWYCEGLMKAIGILLDMEAEQPSAEPKTGRWIVIDETEPRRYGCSNCKRLVWHVENYCPNCGARMEGEDNGI